MIIYNTIITNKDGILKVTQPSYNVSLPKNLSVFRPSKERDLGALYLEKEKT